MSTSVTTRSGVTRWAISSARAPSCASCTTAPLGAEDAREEPGDGGVVVGDDHDLAVRG